MPMPGFSLPARARAETPPAYPVWLRVVQTLGISVSMISLLLIYLPDLPWVGRVFYPLHYQDDIRKQAQAFGIDPLFVAAIIRQESGFQPDARSAVGALGLMQLMPATAQWAARQMRIKQFREAQLLEPAINIRIGCWYLNYLFQRFQDPAKVLAAYNGGEGNVQFWGTLRGEPLAWAYPETQAYVTQCLRAYRRYHDLYGPSRPQGLTR